VTRVLRRTLLDRLRTTGIVTALVIGGTATLAPGFPAQAAPNGTGTVAPPSAAGQAPKNVALPHRKLPRGAVPSTRTLPRPGSYGAAFQPKSTAGPLIVGGTLANATDYPWIVGIETLFVGVDSNGVPGWYKSWCTGTVIAANKVLTAAHCATELPFGETVVIAGRNNLGADTGGYVARVSSSWTDQNFNLAALNDGTANVPIDDVAVLTLKDTLPSAYTPIALTNQGDLTPYAAGTSADIIGYGITATGAADPGTLRKATVPIQSNATCTAALAGYDGSRMTCAGLPTGGVDTCNGDSGGPLVVAGVEAGITDWGQGDCGSSYGVYERLSTYSDPVKADLTRPALINLDWSGDAHSDLMARDSAGELIEFSGSGFANDGFGGFAGADVFNASGWNAYSKLFRVTDWNGDGNPSIMGETPNGTLYQRTSDGFGNFTSEAVQVGTGWNTFTDIMVVNNWNGDGHANLLGRKSNGDLFLYTSDGAGGWLNGGIGIKIGTGWNTFNTVLTPGTWRGTGHQSLIGRKSNGDLFLYESDGAGGWLNGGVGIKIGTGWNVFSVFFSPGDWNGDDMVDLIGITPAGAMSLYETDAHGNWLNGGRGQAIGSGWNGFNAVF
jgi:hypothetical protein